MPRSPRSWAHRGPAARRRGHANQRRHRDEPTGRHRRGRSCRRGRTRHVDRHPSQRSRLHQPRQAPNHRPAAHHRSRDDVHRRARRSITPAALLGGARRRARVRRLRRDQLLVRPRHRPGDGADLQPSAPVGSHSSVAGAHLWGLADRRVGGGVQCCREHPGGSAGARWRALLRPHLHHAAQAQNTAQHRHRWRRRRVSTARRMGGGPGQRRMAGVRALCAGIPVDPATLLVAGAPAST